MTPEQQLAIPGKHRPYQCRHSIGNGKRIVRTDRLSTIPGREAGRKEDMTPPKRVRRHAAISHVICMTMLYYISPAIAIRNGALRATSSTNADSL